MSRLASLSVLCLVCSGCFSRQAVPSSAPQPQPVSFAGDKLRTVTPLGWSGIKDARVTDGEVVTYYELLLRRAEGVEIGIKTYPAGSASVLMMADRLHDSLHRLHEARIEDLEYSEKNEDRASFGYAYSDGTKTLAGKVTVARCGDLGVVVIGTWLPGSASDAAAFEAVVAALSRASP